MSDELTESNQLIRRYVGPLPFSERERLLCEVMFWLSTDRFPVGVWSEIEFLDDMVRKAMNLWHVAHHRRSVIDDLLSQNQKLRDQVYELEMRH